MGLLQESSNVGRAPVPALPILLIGRITKPHAMNRLRQLPGSITRNLGLSTFPYSCQTNPQPIQSAATWKGRDYKAAPA